MAKQLCVHKAIRGSGAHPRENRPALACEDGLRAPEMSRGPQSRVRCRCGSPGLHRGLVKCWRGSGFKGCRGLHHLPRRSETLGLPAAPRVGLSGRAFLRSRRLIKPTPLRYPDFTALPLTRGCPRCPGAPRRPRSGSVFGLFVPCGYAIPSLTRVSPSAAFAQFFASVLHQEWTGSVLPTQITVHPLQTGG